MPHNIFKEWFIKIFSEKKYELIKQNKVKEKSILISPYNIYKVDNNYISFIDESGKEYYLKNPQRKWFFDENDNPLQEKELFFKSNTSFKNGIKLSVSSRKISNSQKLNSLPEEAQETADKVTSWINHIKSDGLEQKLSISNFEEGEIIEVSPYNFKNLSHYRIFINVDSDKKLYLPINFLNTFNKGILDSLKTAKPLVRKIVPLKTEDGVYRLVANLKKTKTKTEDNKKKYDLFGNIVIDNKPKKTFELSDDRHINDVWGIQENANFEDIVLDEYQINALNTSLNNELSIINGYAGTGKSAVVKMISNDLSSKGWIVSRVAPTGRAAQIINGKTIHKWLDPIIGEKVKGRYQILGFSKEYFKEKECLIVDESSMLDDELWSEIKRVWRNSNKIEKKLILVGDSGQLEPVGEGTPFINLLKEPSIPKLILKTIHRSKDSADLALFAEQVRTAGFIPDISNYKSVKFINKELATEMVFNNSIQMITPKRKGVDGSLEINKEIKSRKTDIESFPDFYTQVFYQDPDSLLWRTKDDAPVHLKDKIIVVQNFWEWNITNGTTGIYLGQEKVKLFNHSSQNYSILKLCYKFKNLDSGKVFYLPANKYTRSKIELAYAITIHKSQGSEYNELILYQKNNTHINRKMLYTAVTRAKKNLYIVK